ncbi:sialate O-acetylesterase [Fibrella forsythiae]|uniref:Sialate O-acetylesterase domain-containing protein n=1 Tax=Fibrella forsythiae TaxID=2817061 RepID=A0ABS3JKV4_9BACT|nr:sialate O-acetylesterase [Fibrella forsythiae]MBO0950625.1 hypothetical protein [Fibrella forsythiae]
MKLLFTLAIASFLLLAGLHSVAQSVQLSYPIDRSVTQRNGNDQATVAIAGQLTGGSSAYSYQLWYRTSTLDGSGNVTSTTGWSSVSFQPNGGFSITPIFNKGWYRLDMGVGTGSPLVAVSVKFGVGDVYAIAGQSNAQGVDDSNWGLPSTSGFPEWIVGVNLNWGCRKEYPGPPTFTKIDGQNRISPSGSNSWCYAVLGKKISDANGGMPVAFFNSAYGGSSILNWYESSMGNLTTNAYPFLNNQYCLASGISSDPNYFKGQPYLTLKNTLNYYLSLFGVRALLWHQGETDADPSATSSLKTQDKDLYKARLQAVIDRSRTDFGHSDLSWMIARATFNNGGNITTTVRDAQDEKGGEYDKNKGPDTDYTSANVTTSAYRNTGDLTHFDERSNAGLTYLGTDEWSDKITVNAPGPAGFNRIVANPVPIVYVSGSGLNRTLSVSPLSGAQLYRWGNDINDETPSHNGTNLTSITVGPGTYRCFIKDGSGNWRISPNVFVGCPSCREGVDELVNDDPFGLALKAYPNPFAKELTIEFNVPQAASDVRVEIIDSEGRIIYTVVDAQHDKGLWKHPIKNLNLVGNQVYFCRLKVNDLFTVKKLLSAN